MIPAIDVSVWQGNINETEVPQPIVLIRASYMGNSLAVDADCATNYTTAVNAGKAVGLYHYAGGTDAVSEANFFVRACMPLAENDVYLLDWEVDNPDPVGWCNTFVDYVYQKTRAYPLVYMDISRANAYDWSSVFSKCGFWCAAPSYSWNDTLPVKYTVVLQQGPIITDAGVQDPVDSDMFFGTIDQFKAYGYHAVPPPVISQPTPVPPVPTTPVPPVSTPEPTPAPVIVETPTTTETTTTDGPTTTTAVEPKPIVIDPMNWFEKVINWIKKLLKKG